MIVILTVGDLIDSAKDLPAAHVEIKHVAKRLLVFEAEAVFYSQGGVVKALKDKPGYPAGGTWQIGAFGVELEDRL